MRKIVLNAPGDLQLQESSLIQPMESETVRVDVMNIARYGGRFIVGSVYSGTVQEFAPLPILRKELSIVGAKGPTTYRKSDGTSAVVGVLERIQNDLRKIIRVYDYKDALQAFEDAKSGEAIKAVIRFK